jgi:hypothetical protein
MKTLIPFFFVVFSFYSCKQAEADAYAVEAVALPSKGSYKDNAEYAAVEVVDSAAAVVEEVVIGAPNVKDPSEDISQKIIKTGDLRFETDDIQELIKKYKAIVQNDSEGKNDYNLSRNLTLRIPNENFDAFIKDLSNGVDYFDTKDISIADVTEEYIDVASRIKTKKALEERYLELLKKANKVSEMLEIERELASIREEIEAKEGRLRYLQNKVAMSTITLEFYKSIEHKAGARVSFGSKFVNAIKSGFNGISSFFLWLIEVWPFIIILVALIYFIRKKFKKKTT